MKMRTFGQIIIPVIFALLLALLCSCEGRKDSEGVTGNASGVKSVIALKEPITPTIVEAVTYALPVWREYLEQKPVLMLFSNDPFLKTVPENIEDEVLRSLKDSTEDALSSELDLLSGNPLLLQNMAVTAAIKGGLFSEVIWVVTAYNDIREATTEALQANLKKYGATTAVEPFKLVKSAAGFTGQLYSTPIKIVHLEDLPQLDHVAILHFDTTFLLSTYQGEKATPLIPLLRNKLMAIRQREQAVLEVTLSMDNLIGNRPLISRYFGRVMTDYFSHPELLDTEPAETTLQKEQTLFLTPFADDEETELDPGIMELFETALAESPKDPLLHYSLYRLYRSADKQDLALESLAQAVRYERIFAIEYLKLANEAKKSGQLTHSLELLQRAADALPDSAFIRLQLVEEALESGAGKLAISVLDDLGKITWSKVYYSHIPDLIASLRIQANNMGKKAM